MEKFLDIIAFAILLSPIVMLIIVFLTTFPWQILLGMIIFTISILWALGRIIE